MKVTLLICLIFLTVICPVGTAAVFGQSTQQDLPTPITGNDISGTIRARDIGDSRLTTYYYILKSDQGDLFVNLVTKNFTGDIDVFTADGLKPMTKIVVYADYGESETGRAIYFRKPEKLILRVQGRSPNDDDATFRLKFGGSLAALSPDEIPTGPEIPKTTAENRGGIRVNSVGTILPPLPKPAEPEAEKNTAAETPLERPERRATARTASPENVPAVEKEKTEVELVVTDPVKPTTTAANERPPRNRRGKTARNTTAEKQEKPQTVDDNTADAAPAIPAGTRRKGSPGFRTLTGDAAPTAKKSAEPTADPLASINLVIQFKDGNVLERKMSEVTRFSVDKGVLVVVLKAGGTTRYPLGEVAKVTIE